MLRGLLLLLPFSYPKFSYCHCGWSCGVSVGKERDSAVHSIGDRREEEEDPRSSDLHTDTSQ